MLRIAPDRAIVRHLDAAQIVKVKRNPDGRLWFDHLSEGLRATDHCMAHADAVRITRLIAHHVGAEVL